jgi:hypothetical protein
LVAYHRINISYRRSNSLDGNGTKLFNERPTVLRESVGLIRFDGNMTRKRPLGGGEWDNEDGRRTEAKKTISGENIAGRTKPASEPIGVPKSTEVTSAKFTDRLRFARRCLG